jgi:hypothetical protein
MDDDGPRAASLDADGDVPAWAGRFWNVSLRANHEPKALNLEPPRRARGRDTPRVQRRLPCRSRYGLVSASVTMEAERGRHTRPGPVDDQPGTGEGNVRRGSIVNLRGSVLKVAGRRWRSARWHLRGACCCSDRLTRSHQRSGAIAGGQGRERKRRRQVAARDLLLRNEPR